MPWRAMKRLAKSLRIGVARRLGRAEYLQAAGAEDVDHAAASGASGPTTVRCTLFRSAKSASAVGSVMSTFCSSCWRAVPALPGRRTCCRPGSWQAPGQRVFAAAGTDDEEFHG